MFAGTIAAAAAPVDGAELNPGCRKRKEGNSVLNRCVARAGADPVVGSAIPPRKSPTRKGLRPPASAGMAIMPGALKYVVSIRHWAVMDWMEQQVKFFGAGLSPGPIRALTDGSHDLVGRSYGLKIYYAAVGSKPSVDQFCRSAFEPKRGGFGSAPSLSSWGKMASLISESIPKGAAIMQIDNEEIISEIEKCIRKVGGSFGEWCVGTTKDTRAPFFRRHLQIDVGDGLAYREAFTIHAAQAVVARLVNDRGLELDCEGLPRQAASEAQQVIVDEKLQTVWASASHCHFNQNCRFTSQSTAMQYTTRLTLGGRAWTSIKLASSEQEKALVACAKAQGAWGIVLSGRDDDHHPYDAPSRFRMVLSCVCFQRCAGLCYRPVQD